MKGRNSYITAEVIKWAIKSAKMTEEIAASKVVVTIDKFKDWKMEVIIRQSNRHKLYQKAY